MCFTIYIWRSVRANTLFHRKNGFLCYLLERNEQSENEWRLHSGSPPRGEQRIMVVDDLMVIMFEFAFTRIDRRKYIFGGNYIYSSASLPSKGNKKERHFKYRSNMRL